MAPRLPPEGHQIHDRTRAGEVMYVNHRNTRSAGRARQLEGRPPDGARDPSRASPVDHLRHPPLGRLIPGASASGSWRGRVPQGISPGVGDSLMPAPSAAPLRGEGHHTPVRRNEMAARDEGPESPHAAHAWRRGERRPARAARRGRENSAPSSSSATRQPRRGPNRPWRVPGRAGTGRRHPRPPPHPWRRPPRHPDLSKQPCRQPEEGQQAPGPARPVSSCGILQQQRSVVAN